MLLATPAAMALNSSLPPLDAMEMVPSLFTLKQASLVASSAATEELLDRANIGRTLADPSIDTRLFPDHVVCANVVPADPTEAAAALSPLGFLRFISSRHRMSSVAASLT